RPLPGQIDNLVDRVVKVRVEYVVVAWVIGPTQAAGKRLRGPEDVGVHVDDVGPSRLDAGGEADTVVFATCHPEARRIQSILPDVGGPGGRFVGGLGDENGGVKTVQGTEAVDLVDVGDDLVVPGRRVGPRPGIGVVLGAPAGRASQRVGRRHA